MEEAEEHLEELVMDSEEENLDMVGAYGDEVKYLNFRYLNS